MAAKRSIENVVRNIHDLRVHRGREILVKEKNILVLIFLSPGCVMVENFLLTQVLTDQIIFVIYVK